MTAVVAACGGAEGEIPIYAAPVASEISKPDLDSLSIDLGSESAFASLANPERESADQAKVALGKYLFFDPALSGDQLISCAACHDLEPICNK